MRDPSWLRGGWPRGMAAAFLNGMNALENAPKPNLSLGPKADAAFPNFSDFFNFYFFLNGVNAQTVRKPKPKITHKVF